MWKIIAVLWLVGLIVSLVFNYCASKVSESKSEVFES